MSALHRNSARRPLAAIAASLMLVLGGCGLEDQELPDLDGPSELGFSIRLTASPDIITADGFSTSLITATVFDSSGRPAGGLDIFFAIADESGRFADIGSLLGQNGPGTGATVRTNAQGVAQVVYQAPARTDATANQHVVVGARPVGTDANAAVYRTVKIELRSAEPRLFPQNPNNEDPNCFFIVEAPNGLRTNVTILFQSTSNDPDGTIVRYEWDFGNGKQASNPDAATAYGSPGSYTVTHKVTDDDGGQDMCAASLTIQ